MVTRLTSKGDQQRSSRSSELSEYYNCEPKKGEKAQPHFRIIVPLYKKAASHTLMQAHTDIFSHAQTLTYECVHTHTHTDLS